MSALKLGPLDIPFTQFLRPDGRTREAAIERSPEIVEQARALLAHGCRFEIEELMDRTVSMTVERGENEDDGPIAIQLCPNGPDVPPTVDTLIREAYDRVVRVRQEAGR